MRHTAVKFQGQTCNPGQKVVHKFTKLRKIGFCMKMIFHELRFLYGTADFLRDFDKTIKIWHLGVNLGTRHQDQAFQRFS